MSKITEVIGVQAYEQIRDRIGEILFDELSAQYAMTYDQDINVKKVFLERCIPFDKVEPPTVNVSLARGAMDNHNALSTDGTYTFHVDIYTKAPSTKTDDGTSIANMRMHKLIGICRAILEDARYLTLGFAPPFIMNRHVIDLNFADPTINDGMSMVMGRLRYSVRGPETNGKAAARILAGYETTIKLHTSEEGYYYFGGPDAESELGFNYDLDFNL